jgi:hypothetical protein
MLEEIQTSNISSPCNNSIIYILSFVNDTLETYRCLEKQGGSERRGEVIPDGGN